MVLDPKSTMSRRAVLRAAGTMIALPVLDSLLPRGARAAVTSSFPQRMVTFYVPCGINMVDYTPTALGTNFAMTPTLTPLTALKSYVTVASGLTNHSAQVQVNGQGGDHGRGTGSFGNGTSVAANGTYNGGGTTFDQMIANKIGTQTRFPSMQLTVEGGGIGGSCDSGFNCAYQGTISWADANTPLMPTTQPSNVFTQLFGDSGSLQQTAAQAALRTATRKSILDGVLGRITSLTTKLNTTDQQKLDQYLTSLREVEREVTLPAPAACNAASNPGNGSDFPTVAAAHVKLMTLAVQCDATRVISFMLGTSGSYHDCSFLNYNGAPINAQFHTITHLAAYNGDAAQNRGALTVINTWSVQQLANFATALYNTPEGSGNMLDNTIIYLGSEISDGNAHNHNDMPVLLVGKGGGAYTGGQHVQYSNNESLADMYMYMMQQFGVSVSSFGNDGTKVLTGLA